MLAIAGLLIVLVSVVVGYLMAGGHMAVLFQPNEFVVIGGAAVGSLLTSTPPSVMKELGGQLGGIVKAGRSKKEYQDLLVMGFELLSLVRREGQVALEPHIQNPAKSSIIGKYASFTSDKSAVTFLTDTLELLISGSAVSEHELGELLEGDIEVQHHDGVKPSKALASIGDALPGLGIVAAVLGVVITMGHIDGPPAEIGHHVAAALVGTFLGILMSYGFVQPLAANIAAKVDAHKNYLMALRNLLLSLQKGTNPTIAVELARRSLSKDVRPSSSEVNAACRALKESKG